MSRYYLKIGDRTQKGLRVISTAICIAAILAMPATAGTLTYDYDDLGRVVRVTYPDGKTTTYSYDIVDNRTATETAPLAPSGPISVTARTNLRTLSGYTGTTPVSLSFVVPAGTTIWGVASENQGAAIDTGTWPAGSTITLTIEGKVYGYGGVGGNGGTGGNNAIGTSGGTGGAALLVRHALTVTMATGGELKGGGGGGAGGTATNKPPGNVGYCGGTGGGGGAPFGAGGLGNSGTAGAGSNGGAATLTAPGSPGGSSCYGVAQGGTGCVPGANGNSAASGTSAPPGAVGNSVKMQGVTITCPTGAGVAGPCGV